MPTEITAQLASYFAWVEREVGAPMHRAASSTGPGPFDGDPLQDEPLQDEPLQDEPQPAETAHVVELTRATAPSRRQARRPFVLAVLAAAAIIAVLLVVRAAGDATPVTPVDSVSTGATVATDSVAPEPTPTETPSGDVTTTSLPLATTVARPVIDTLALGESVMHGALTALTEAGVHVDAEESVQATGMIAKLAADLATYDITNAVVIQVGTNGPVTAEQYAELADLVADVPHVFFMTAKAPKDWIAPNNALINALPATHPNVQIIDWATAGVQIEGELSSSDGGIHLNSGTAIRYYSNLILGALGKAQIPNP